MKKVKLFLDSGAFSAYNQGVTINLKEYIAFIKTNKSHLEVYANLDVIGNPDATLINQKKMEKAGLHPIPCFHYGEDVKYLLYYLQHYKYIALGGMVPVSTRDLKIWLDGLFSKYICDAVTGLPKVKVHGFGMTSFSLLRRYPWYSVDSTSWVLTGRMGAVFVPRWRKGEWVYNEDAWKITVSTRSSKKETILHIDAFSKTDKIIILNYLKDKGYVLGKSSFKIENETYEVKKGERWNGKAQQGKREVEKIIQEGISNNYIMRDELNILYYVELEKHFPKWPWPFKPILKSKGFEL